MAQGDSTSENIRRQRKQRNSGSPTSDQCQTNHHLHVPNTPPRMTHSIDEGDSMSPMPARGRTNSREYVNNYDKTFSCGQDDMVGFDIARHAGGWWENQQWYFFSAYVIALIFVGAAVMSVASLANSKLGLTAINVVHFLVTLFYLHWGKGAYDDEHGELSHMTLWEQIDGTPRATNLRLAFRVVPTIICYLACWEAGWDDWMVCAFNCIVWYLSLLGKMPFMNGVRIFGINAHPLLGKGKEQ